MNLKRIATIFRKELRDMLRDRRTLVAMIGIPVVLYPVLFIFATQAAVMHQNRLERTESRVGLAPGTDPVVREWLKDVPMVRVLDSVNAADALYRREIDVVVSTDANVRDELSRNETVNIEIGYDVAEPDSRKALGRVRDGLIEESEDILDSRLMARGIDKPFVRPLEVRDRNFASPRKASGAIIGTILPLLMVVMLGVGAFYPAIDLTAGEKERGTFETLLSTPTETAEIVYGKFLTVFCLSLLAGLLNLGSLLATFAVQLAQLDIAKTSLEINLPPATAAAILLVMLPLAFLISALMMMAAMFARTFKEAQNIMTPFFILILMPAGIAAMPGTQLNSAFQFVPIANVALLFKELMVGEGTAQDVFAVFVSTTAFALAALAAAVWIFKREEMILAEERGIPFTLKRAEFTPRQTPTVGMSFFLYAVVLLLIFYVGTTVQARALIGGLLVTQWLLILAPTLLFLVYTRVNVRETLNLRMPPIGALLGTLVVGVAWTLLVIEFNYLQNRVFPAPPELTEQMAQLYKDRGTGWPLAMLLLAGAVSPAVCEEALFRGAILSGFRNRWPGWLTVLAVGLLFGLLHISVYRVPLTAASGIVLAYLALRSGSIYPAMLVHLLINTTGLLAAARFGETLDAYRIEERGEPLWMVLAALAALVVGLAIFEVSVRNRTRASGSPAGIKAGSRG